MYADTAESTPPDMATITKNEWNAIQSHLLHYLFFSFCLQGIHYFILLTIIFFNILHFIQFFILFLNLSIKFGLLAIDLGRELDRFAMNFGKELSSFIPISHFNLSSKSTSRRV